MSKFVGQKFKGTISSIEEYGFFVELENTIRGLVRFNDLKEYKSSDLYQIEFFGDKKLTFGQEIEIIVSGVNIPRGLVDFVPSGFLVYTKEEKDKERKEYKRKKYSKGKEDTNKRSRDSNFRNKKDSKVVKYNKKNKKNRSKKRGKYEYSK